MPNWKKLIVSGSAAEITTLKATGLSADSSETQSLMINDDGVVKTRTLGSAAFSNTSAFTAAGVDNSTDVTLTGTPDYITISGQTITRNQIDLANDVTGILPSANLDSDTAHLSGTQTFSGNKSFSGTFSASAGVQLTGLSTQNSETKSLMITTGGVVGYRSLGTGAFAAEVTNNSGLTNGAGYTTNTGTVDTSGTPVDNDYAKFTDANTIEGRSVSEVKSDLSLNNVENTAISTFAGSTNISTLGTIEAGTWNGSVITSAFLDSDTAHLSGAQTFSGNKAFSGTFSTSGNMKFTGLSAVEDSKAVVINGDTGVVGYKDLGTGAFATVGTISGTSNTVPKFTGTNSIGNSEITDSGTVIQLGSNSSSQPTLYLDTNNRKVGFRTTSPESAFDVNGTMRVRNQLNVGHTSEQNLYVNGNGSAGGQYVKIGNYKASTASWPANANYFGITERENQPKYFLATGTGGKIVQGMRIATIKLTASSNAFKNLSSTGTTLIPAPGTDYFIVPHFITVHCDGAGAVGSWSSNAQAAIGFCQNNTCTYNTGNGGQFTKLFPIKRAILVQTGSWIYNITKANTSIITGTNKALLLKSNDNLTTAPASNWYIQIHYQLINKTAGIINNADKTLTGNS